MKTKVKKQRVKNTIVNADFSHLLTNRQSNVADKSRHDREIAARIIAAGKKARGEV